MAERKPVSQTPHNPGEYGAQIVPKRKVTVNHDGLICGACYDGPDKLEAIYRLTAPTLVRLGYDPKTDGKARTKPPGTGGNTPNTLDLKRWLDSLEDTPDNEGEINFLLVIHATIRGRLADTVLDKVHQAL